MADTTYQAALDTLTMNGISEGMARHALQYASTQSRTHAVHIGGFVVTCRQDGQAQVWTVRRARGS
jgi:hypothetical protein